VKLKKPSSRQMTVIGVVALVRFAFVASRSADDSKHDGLDAPARLACDDFNGGYPGAVGKPVRLALADTVTTSSRKSGNDNVKERADEWARTADDGGAAWKSSADALAAACRDAGWTAP
jgi:hypothetical protein